MQVIITGLVSDSAAKEAFGTIEFSQAQRMDNGEMLITSRSAEAQVVSGRLQTLSGSDFSLPHNPTGTAVRVLESLGGETFEWWTAIPEVSSVEYRELQPVESSSVPESVWGPPPWLVEVVRLKDETLEAIEAGSAVAEGLGGLAGIETLLNRANQSAEDSSASADAATAQATRAAAEADRAEQAASSVDMDAINQRLDGMLPKSQDATSVYATSAAGDQVNMHYGPDIVPDALVQRDASGAVTTLVNPSAANHAASKKYTDDLVASVKAAVVDDLAAMGTSFLQMQDMVTAVRIGTSPNGGVELAGSFEFAILTPSQQIEVTGCYLVFDNDQALPASTTKKIDWRLFHRASTPGTALDIVQKSTSADGMTVRRKVWDMTNGTWGSAANRKVPKGNVISLLPTNFTGGAVVTFPMLVVIHWRPVR